MGFLRGGSTIAGKRIATEDMFLEVIKSNEAMDINSRIAKYEGLITTVTDFNNLTLDKSSNGIYDVQISNKITNDPLIINKKDGILFSACTDSGKMQLFSTQENSGQAEFYLNSGLADNNFQKIALQKDLDTKLSLTGGSLTGPLNSNSNIATTSDIRCRIGHFDSGLSSEADIQINNSQTQIRRVIFHRNDGSRDTSCFMYADNINFGLYDRTNNKEVLQYKFADSILRSNSPHLELNGCRVWHTGNLNPDNYVSKNYSSMNDLDLNNILIPGYYYGMPNANKPAGMSNWIYLEVVGAQDILQKVYDAYLNKSFWRTKTNGKWGTWSPLGGNASYSKAIAVADWRDSDNDGAYETTITHNLGLPNITSVILTDSNGYSMSTGFSTIDNNRLIVYCGTNPVGKIVVNATN